MAKKSSKVNKLLIGILIIVGIFAIGISGILLTTVVAGGGFLYTYLNVARPFQIAGESMSPNYKNGQFYLTVIIHQDTPIKRGDVIIFKDPQEPDKDFVKRVIALPGDTVMVQNGNLYLNNGLQDESYTNGAKTYAGSFLKEGESVTVPEGNYFVLGDNRPYSSDSREWGFVPRKNLISTIGACYHNCN